MDWTRYRQVYPESVLNQTAVSILALLERLGKSTEENLSTALNVDTSKINDIALKLHKNRLIIYHEKYLSVSDLGRIIIDKFKLNADIIDSIADDLKLQGKERDKFTFIIGTYRESSFENYLDTLFSARFFESSCQRLTENPKSQLREMEDAKLVLWVRDLRDWMIYSNAKKKNENDTWKSLVKILTDYDADPVRVTADALRPAHTRASRIRNAAIHLDKILVYLNKIDVHELQIEQLKDLDKNLCLLIDFQRRKDRNSWYEALLHSRRGQEALSTTIQRYLNEVWADKQSSAGGELEKLSWEWWTNREIISLTPPKTVWEFIATLRRAQDHAALAEELLMTMKDTHTFLEIIQAESQRLLDGPIDNNLRR